MQPVTDKAVSASRHAFRAIGADLRQFGRLMAENHAKISDENLSRIDPVHRRNVQKHIYEYVTNLRNWLISCSESAAALCASGNTVCIPTIIRPAVEASAKFIDSVYCEYGILSLIKRSIEDFDAIASTYESIGNNSQAASIRGYVERNQKLLEGIRSYSKNKRTQDAAHDALCNMGLDKEANKKFSKVINLIHELNFHYVAHGRVLPTYRMSRAAMMHQSLSAMDVAKILYIDGCLKIISYEEHKVWAMRCRSQSEEYRRAVNLLGKEMNLL